MVSNTSISENDDSEDETQPSKNLGMIEKKTVQPPKKHENTITVCLTNCRYKVIRKVAMKLGYKETHPRDNWNLYWTDYFINLELCRNLKRYQKINHFPGILEICRKDLLARNLNRMLRLFPKEYNIYPRTWVLPSELGDVLSYSRIRRNKTYIIKPDAGCQGRGIYVTKALNKIGPRNHGVCQIYLTRPFLIDGYKFDLRIYVLMTSCIPLRIFVYEEGIVRFATRKYEEPDSMNVNNVFMHLTNYSVNKFSRTYNQDIEAGSKRKLTWFNDYMRLHGHDIKHLWRNIDDVIIKTIIAAYPVLHHSYKSYFSKHDCMPACSELLGFDILLDYHLNPLILEVNHSPSFHTETALDWEIKEAVMMDMFAMLNLEGIDKQKMMKEDKQRMKDKLLFGTEEVTTSYRKLDEYFQNEVLNRGRFRLVYPNIKSKDYYDKFFEQQKRSMFNPENTKPTSSAQNAINEMELRARIEAFKRIAPKLSPIPSSTTHTKLMNNCPSPKQISHDVSNKIVEIEERDRLQLLAERDFMMKYHGIWEHIYFAMKKNGNLRPGDEKKYALFEKSRPPSSKSKNNFNDEVAICHKII